jgi:DnaJ-class molecular chaperone
MKQSLNISLEEAFKGTLKEFDLNGKRIRVKIEPGTEEGKKLRLKKSGRCRYRRSGKRRSFS